MNDRNAEGAGFQRRLGTDFASADFNAALKVRVNSGENFDERAFAGAIFAGQNMNFAAAHFQPRVFQNRYVAKALGDAGHANQDRRFGFSFGLSAVHGIGADVQSAITEPATMAVRL